MEQLVAQAIIYGLILIPLGICYLISELLHKSAVKAHKNDLLKGGLVKKQSQRVHKDVMSQLGREYPNRHLPKRQYYD